MGNDKRLKHVQLRSRLSGFREGGTFVVLLLISGWLAYARPSFRDPENLLQVGRAFSLIAIMAVGQTLVIITGGIDVVTSANVDGFLKR